MKITKPIGLVNAFRVDIAMGISRFQPCTEERNLGTFCLLKRKRKKEEEKRWSSKGGVFFCSVRTLRYEITFNENDTNVLIFLDTTNDKRFKKNVSSKAIDPVPLCTYFSLYRARD